MVKSCQEEQNFALLVESVLLKGKIKRRILIRKVHLIKKYLIDTANQSSILETLGSTPMFIMIKRKTVL